MSAVARRCSAVFLRPRAASCSAATIRAVASAIPACRVKVASCSCRDRGDRDGVGHEEVSRTPPVVRSTSRGGRTVTPVGVPPVPPMALCHHDGDVVRARAAAANCGSSTCRSSGAVIRVTSASFAAFVSETNTSLTSCELGTADPDGEFIAKLSVSCLPAGPALGPTGRLVAHYGRPTKAKTRPGRAAPTGPQAQGRARGHPRARLPPPRRGPTPVRSGPRARTRPPG